MLNHQLLPKDSDESEKSEKSEKSEVIKDSMDCTDVKTSKDRLRHLTAVEIPVRKFVRTHS